MPMLDFTLGPRGVVRASVPSPRHVIRDPEPRLRALCVEHFKRLDNRDSVLRLQRYARLKRRSDFGRFHMLNRALSSSIDRLDATSEAILRELRRFNRLRAVVLIDGRYLAAETGKRDGLDNPITDFLIVERVNGSRPCPNCDGCRIQHKSDSPVNSDEVETCRHCKGTGIVINHGVADWFHSLPVAPNPKTAR